MFGGADECANDNSIVPCVAFAFLDASRLAGRRQGEHLVLHRQIRGWQLKGHKKDAEQ